jgi:monofunctional biosynthetic peptidoglycan transglycosylase
MAASKGGALGFARVAWKVFCYSLGAFVLIGIAVQGWFYAQVLWFRVYQPAQTAFMEARLRKLREKNPNARLQHQWVPYEKISAQLKRAVVASEDAKFMDHEGFDWEAISKAIEKNEKKGKVVSGASTISQQLAKNLFLSGERSYVRKGEEAVITWMLESTLSKRRILELYLNFAEWGEGVFGAEAAAKYHFGGGAASLSASQAAYLAVILPSPRRYVAGKTTPFVSGRIETILGRMPAAQIP